MKKIKHVLVALVCGHLFCSACVPTVAAQDAVEQGTRLHRYSERLSAHIQGRTKYLADKKSIAFSEELKQEGDGFYKNNDYYHAIRKYEDARIYLPSPEIIFLIGDSKMRFSLSNAKNNSLFVEGNNCWPAFAFAYEVSNNVVLEYYELGFDLADHFKMSSLKKGQMYFRAMQTATCLQRQVSKWAGRGVLENPQACVDLKAVEACMGNPLLSK